MTPTCASEDRLVIGFAAHMDTARCVRVEADVRAAVTKPDRPVVFDLAGVDFISSSFLRLCIYAFQQAGEQGFRVVHAGPSVKRVFKIAGLDAMLEADEAPTTVPS